MMSSVPRKGLSSLNEALDKSIQMVVNLSVNVKNEV